jgi:hypothetical protein
VDDVSDVIVIGEDTRTRADRELEGKTTLCIFTARVHAHFHVALPHGAAVAVSGEMPDSVKHQASKADSIG